MRASSDVDDIIVTSLTIRDSLVGVGVVWKVRLFWTEEVASLESWREVELGSGVGVGVGVVESVSGDK